MANPAMNEAQISKILVDILDDIEQLDHVADKARNDVTFSPGNSALRAELTKAAALATYQVASLRLDLMKLAVVGK